MGLMDNLKDIASKAGEELKKAGEEAQKLVQRRVLQLVVTSKLVMK